MAVNQNLKLKLKKVKKNLKLKALKILFTRVGCHTPGDSKKKMANLRLAQDIACSLQECRGSRQRRPGQAMYRPHSAEGLGARPSEAEEYTARGRAKGISIEL